LKRRARVVAREMGSVEVNTLDRPKPGEFHYAPIMPRLSSPPRLPTIHPFTVVIVFPRDEYGRFRAQHSFLGSKELVAGLNRKGAEPSVGEVNEAPCKLRRLRVKRWIRHENGKLSEFSHISSFVVRESVVARALLIHLRSNR
jgi:hypothetical protein